jgi:diaminopimelate epimerase
MGTAVLRGAVTVHSNHSDLDATAVHVPNPHAVTFVPELSSLGVIVEAPSFAPSNVFPDGANVEFVERLGKAQARIIIYERGSGLTQSCGTGACAVAAVLATTPTEAGQEPGVSAGLYRIQVPGGVLSVIVDDDLSVKLIGPAELTGQGELAQDWWQANS